MLLGAMGAIVASSSFAAKADTARTSVPTLPPGVGCGATRNTSCFGRAAAAAEEKEEEEEEEEEEEGDVVGIVPAVLNNL